MQQEAHARATPSADGLPFTFPARAIKTAFTDAEAILAAFRPHVSAQRFREATQRLQAHLDRWAEGGASAGDLLIIARPAAERLNEESGRPLRPASLRKRAWVGAMIHAAEKEKRSRLAPTASAKKASPGKQQRQTIAAAVPVERQASRAVHAVPFASEGNVLALRVSAAEAESGSEAKGEMLGPMRVRLTETPAWLTFERDAVSVTGEEEAARFSFTVSEDAPAGRRATLVFAVEDAGGGVLVAEKAVRVEVSAPATFALHGNAPNPFRGQTKISYQLPEAADVTVEVYDVLGRRVKRLEEGRKAAGGHTARLEAGRLSSGIYFYTVEIESSGQRRWKRGKMVLVR